MPKTDPTLLARAKGMRRNPTPAEVLLWFRLRAKQFENAKFSHQVVIAPYIADFVARSRKLIVEVTATPTRFPRRMTRNVLRTLSGSAIASSDSRMPTCSEMQKVCCK